ncbi:hypothetical protein SAMN05444746_13635 [Variovorax sp. OK212]|nr:hypothetical protein SAMN05518853_1583 [Variovorax sp. OK202]SFE75271.1 hypothetical protein SAMN05444746_13635 [Variovorax sp. OK212]
MQLRIGRVIGLSLAICGILSGCGEPREPTGHVAHSNAGRLEAYASTLMSKHSSLARRGESEQTDDSPLTYSTVFILASEVSNVVDASLSPANWQATYCSPQLMELMEKQGIDIAFGALKDSSSKPTAVAACSRTQPRPPPPTETSPTLAVGNFEAVQICRAALSVLYQRDAASMRGAMVDGFAQVKYERPTDGRQLSYRCKLRGDAVLTWDDNIAGARWFGEAADGSQTRFRTSGDELVVEALTAGKVERELRFSRADLSRQ